MIFVCFHCQKIYRKDDDLDSIGKADAVSHGICPPCFELHYGDDAQKKWAQESPDTEAVGSTQPKKK